jgi:hypothetical protein
MAPDIEERWGTVHEKPDVTFLLCWGAVVSATATEFLVLLVPYLGQGKPIPLAVSIPTSVVCTAACVVSACLWIFGPAVYWPSQLRPVFPTMCLASFVPLFVIYHPQFKPRSSPFVIVFEVSLTCLCIMILSVMGADSASHPTEPLTAVLPRLLYGAGMMLHLVDIVTDSAALWIFVFEVCTFLNFVVCIKCCCVAGYNIQKHARTFFCKPRCSNKGPRKRSG